MKTLRLGLVFTRHITVTPLAILFDQLRLAMDRNRAPGMIELIGMSSQGLHRAPLMGGLIRATSSLLAPDSLDAVIVVGDDESHLNSQVDAATLDYLARVGNTHVPLIGIGAGIGVLCRAGVMKRRKLCTSWKLHRELVSAFPDHTFTCDQTFLADGLRITCVGGSGVIRLAHYLFKSHLSRVMARTNRLSVTLDFPGRPGPTANDDSNRPELMKDPRLHRCLTLMEENLSHPRPLRMIGNEMAMSSRALQRLFQKCIGLSPTEVCKRLRMRYAPWLIENTNRRILDVAFESGFSSSAHFARAFRRFYGHAPVERRSLQRHRMHLETTDPSADFRRSKLQETLEASSL